MEEIIFATSNEGKMEEVRSILKDLNFKVISLKECGIFIDITEDGDTFSENAKLKARTINKLTGKLVLADDSGLEIDYLDGAPGIFSARFLGEDTPYSYKNQYLVDQLSKVPEKARTARFVCAVAAVFPDGSELCKTAALEGRIADHAAGGNGFGYDPIFFLPEYGCTTAELSAEKKNQISHRAKALALIKEELRSCQRY